MAKKSTKGRGSATRFAKGQSGNPRGRPPLDAASKAALRLTGPAAIARLCALVDSVDERIAHAASSTILDRLYGKRPLPLDEVSKDANVRLAELEEELHRRALSGDTRALELALRVAAPQRYGEAAEMPGDEAPRTLRLVLAEPRHVEAARVDGG